MTSSTIANSLSELPEYRQVLANLIARDLKVKYQSKSLGFAWSLLAPACMLAILYMIFGGAFRVNMPHYWAFLVASILPFQFMQESILAGAGSIRSSAGLIRKVYVPMEILVVAGITVRAIEFVLQMGLAVALLAALHYAGGTFEHIPAALAPHLPAGGHVQFDPLKTLAVLPGAILLTYLFVLGVALPLSAWCVIYKDVEHIITIAMRVLFYGTPVFWGAFQFMPKPWVRWMVLNPMGDLIALYRGPLYFGTWPFNEAAGGGALTAWGLATLFAVVTLVVGYALFDRSKRILAEVV
jgi:ABC-type polysaccharide/polyol phosphate export permease